MVGGCAEAQRILEAEKPACAASRAAEAAHSAVTVHVAAPRAAAAKRKAAARYMEKEQSEDEDDSDGNQIEKEPEEKLAKEDAALFCMDLGHKAATQKQFSEKCAARRPAARSALTHSCAWRVEKGRKSACALRSHCAPS